MYNKNAFCRGVMVIRFPDITKHWLDARTPYPFIGQLSSKKSFFLKIKGKKQSNKIYFKAACILTFRLYTSPLIEGFVHHRFQSIFSPVSQPKLTSFSGYYFVALSTGSPNSVGDRWTLNL